jgi:hypothetical protein
MINFFLKNEMKKSVFVFWLNGLRVGRGLVAHITATQEVGMGRTAVRNQTGQKVNEIPF